MPEDSSPHTGPTYFRHWFTNTFVSKSSPHQRSQGSAWHFLCTEISMNIGRIVWDKSSNFYIYTSKLLSKLALYLLKAERKRTKNQSPKPEPVLTILLLSYSKNPLGRERFAQELRATNGLYVSLFPCHTIPKYFIINESLRLYILWWQIHVLLFC